MEQKDYWTDTLRHKEKADEDRYFAEQDRRLIKQRQRQGQTRPTAGPGETPAEVPTKKTPLESDSTEPPEP